MKLCFGSNSKSPAQFTDITWSELTKALQLFQLIERVPDKETKTNDTPWFSPMILFPGSTKKEISNVSRMSNFMTFDLDSPGWDIDRLIEMINDYRFIAYTTTSSKREEPRWRVVLSTSRETTTTEYVTLWHWVNQFIFENDVDPKTKNVNRLSYMPAAWVGADNVFATSSGLDLNVDEILIAAVKQQAPQIPVQIGQLPGVHSNKTIITSKMISNYQGRSKGGRLYDMMCSAAKRFKLNGWALNATDLAAEAMMVSQTFDPGLSRPNILGEASKAIGWAESNIKEQTALEKLMNKLQYQNRFIQGE